MTPSKEQIAAYFRHLQAHITQALQKVDAQLRIQKDAWQRTEGGGGLTQALIGQIWEKGGINTSTVHGHLPRNLQKKWNMQAKTFYATGLSLILHPVHPHVPIIHMNLRYFEAPHGGAGTDYCTDYWFGGGWTSVRTMWTRKMPCAFMKG